MIMIRNKQTYIAIAVLSMLALSCNDDWLDLKPVAAQNSGSFYLTMGQAEQAVTAAYSTFCTTTSWDRDIVMVFGDVTSDDAEAGGDFENEVPDVEEFNRMTMLTTNGHLDATYGDLFRGVYFANLAMERIPNVVNTDPNASQALIDLRIAELKFIRAINYMYLIHIFGAVPLIDHVLSPSEYQMGRSTFKDLFDFMEKDLLDAIPILPEKIQLSASDIGRATKGAAKALLARLYLFESSYAKYYPGDERFTGLTERWGDVLDYCEQVINSGEYRLVGTDGETYPTWRSPESNGFRFMFTAEADNCDESVFEVQYINDALDYAVTRAGSLVQWISPRYYIDTSGVSQNTGYWGLGYPTQSLYNEFDTLDPRFAVTFSLPGDSVEISGGTRHPIDFLRSSTTGMYDNKYECSAAQFADAPGHQWQKSPVNCRLIRYADVILMACEAAIMTGDNNKAKTYINMVRTRARNCGTTNVPADLDGTITFEQLVKERRMELALEGRRFFDLVRWNLATQYIDNNHTGDGYPIHFESPKYDFMPLPEREVSLSGGALKQYPGW
jgi:hypothetical protein